MTGEGGLKALQMILDRNMGIPLVSLEECLHSEGPLANASCYKLSGNASPFYAPLVWSQKNRKNIPGNCYIKNAFPAQTSQVIMAFSP